MGELKNLKGRKVLVHDMALRDGMHAKQLMPPFSWEHPDAMDAFKRY